MFMPYKLVLTYCMLCMMTFGCVSLMNTPKVSTSCSADAAWSEVLASVDEFELRRIDKANGVIETDWIALQSKRRAGALQRDVNEERARFVLTITPEQSGNIITVLQDREFWSPMGQQQRTWRRISPNQEEEQRLAARIQKRLKARGC